MKPAGALLAVALAAAAPPALAHNPIFAPGPHVTYKGGVELALEYRRERASGAGEERRAQALTLGLEYGLTADWTAELEVPFQDLDESGSGASGLGDIVLRTRYRFLRLDSPGEQRSAALLLQVKLPTGDEDGKPRLGSGSVDVVGGLLLGREGRRWYYNAAARYRLNGKGAGGIRKGDRQLLDLIGGLRPLLTGYLEPDTVLFVELNWENAFRDELAGAQVSGSGGWELFLSPGVFWTFRNVALRGGVQIPIAEALNGSQQSSDYRLKLELKYTF